jgi:DNA-binding NarL/FixJ family response regulator
MLVWSTHSESLYAERALRAGALGYINKEQATDKIIEMNPSAKILIISALRDRATAINAIKRGASGFLCKPMNPEELREAFQLLIND